MATINITLADSMKTFIEEQAAKGGFETVGEYLNAMIRDIHERERNRREVRGKLLEAVRSSPATPMTEADWEAIRREEMARINDHDI